MPDNILSTSRLFAGNSLVYKIILTNEDKVKQAMYRKTLLSWNREMDFNPDKCEFLRLTKKKKNSYINTRSMQTVDQAKYLGTSISKDHPGINTSTL